VKKTADHYRQIFVRLNIEVVESLRRHIVELLDFGPDSGPHGGADSRLNGRGPLATAIGAREQVASTDGDAA